MLLLIKIRDKYFYSIEFFKNFDTIKKPKKLFKMNLTFFRNYQQSKKIETLISLNRIFCGAKFLKNDPVVTFC
jgi:hypothetical protein